LEFVEGKPLALLLLLLLLLFRCKRKDLRIPSSILLNLQMERCVGPSFLLQQKAAERKEKRN
jgi:hypothetical protein